MNIMSWQEKLRINFEREDYEQCITLLNEELTKPFCDDEDLSLNLMYVYMFMFMLKKGSNTERQMIFLERKILEIYKLIKAKYVNSAKAIFYTAYNSSIAEWILGLDLEDINEMYHKAWLLEPGNKLYRYGYYLYFLHNLQEANSIYVDIRNDEYCWREIKMMSVIGDEFIQSMQFFYNSKHE